jgi:hypothetical protein
MINRTIAAGFCAICAVGLALAPDDVSARSGGIAGRSLALGARHVGGLPLVKPGQIPVIKPAVAGGFSGLRAVRRHHRFSRNGVPLLDGVGGPYYEPYGYSGYTGIESPYPQTITNARPVPPGDPVVVNGRVCFAQAYIVPSEAGGTRPVTVTRC